MRYRNGIFLAEANLANIMAWNPASWSIPVDADLTSFEVGLTEPLSPEDVRAERQRTNAQPHMVRELDLPRVSSNTKWFFSAAAVCIDYRT